MNQNNKTDVAGLAMALMNAFTKLKDEEGNTMPRALDPHVAKQVAAILLGVIDEPTDCEALDFLTREEKRLKALLKRQKEKVEPPINTRGIL